MTGENSQVLKSPSIHPGVLRTICYQNDLQLFVQLPEKEAYNWEVGGGGESEMETERETETDR